MVYAIFGDSLYTIDKTTGIASSAIGVLPADLQSIAFRPDGALFGVTGSDLIRSIPRPPAARSSARSD